MKMSLTRDKLSNFITFDLIHQDAYSQSSFVGRKSKHFGKKNRKFYFFCRLENSENLQNYLVFCADFLTMTMSLCIGFITVVAKSRIR